MSPARPLSSGRRLSWEMAMTGRFNSRAMDLTEREILDFPWPKAADFDFSPLQAEAEKNSNRVRIGGQCYTTLTGELRIPPP